MGDAAVEPAIARQQLRGACSRSTGWVRALLLTGLVLVISAALSGCSLGYYLHTARGQAALMSQRVPIEELLDDPATAPGLRARLERVTLARRFASEVLGLPEDKGFRTYADINRGFAVWSVTATEEFSLEPLQWCFPIAGCVAYRGYFSEQGALRFAEGLNRRGFDVSVRGVATYSTLGWFEDPVLSSMLRWDDVQLIAIIFHELAHQRLYIKNDTAFNESFASVVEQAGMRRWTRVHGSGEELQRYLERSRSSKKFSDLVENTRRSLRELYASSTPPAAMRVRKAALLADLVSQYQALRDAGAISAGYETWFARDLNNADLAAVGIYDQWVPALARLLLELDGDLNRFYAEAERLGSLPAPERARALTRLAAGQYQPGAAP